MNDYLYLDDLTVSTTHLEPGNLITPWKWLINDFKQLFIVSKMGDLFYQTENNTIHWLATDTGTSTMIATDLKEFDLLLKDEDNVDNWFLPSLAEDLNNEGKLLKDNQVYSYKEFPVIGGEYTIDNIEPKDIVVHFAITGQIHEQIKDLPDGMAATLTIVD